MPRDMKTGHLTQGVVSPLRSVPPSIKRPHYVGRPMPDKFTGSDIKTPEQIEKIRAAGKIAAQAIALVGEHCKPGITTDELDQIGHDFVVSQGAYPSALQYRGFPKAICTSVNEVICHGIPDNTVLQDGDIVNIDITAFKDGYHGDSNQTFLVGQVSQEARELVERTREALSRAISVVAPGREINIIGRTIESYAKRFGYGVVRDFTGHGIGEAFHSGLVIPHYDCAPEYAIEMQVGMVFTIEPMLNLGTHDWKMWKDGWTVVTADQRISAQFEHTLVVTESGAEVLTLP